MDFVEFQSDQNGLYVQVPEDSEINTNDGEDLIIENEDYTLTVHYFDASETDDDEISDMLEEYLDATELDFEDAEEEDFETETLAGSIISAASDELLAMGGVLYSKENDEIGFIYTLVAPADYADEAGQIIGTLEFNPEEIADE